jgi:streptogramin lyase
MKVLQGSLLCLVLVASSLLVAGPAFTADSLEGQVLGGGAPIANSAVTLWAASTGEPQQLAQARTSADGRFAMTVPDSRNADAVLYLVAKGGQPTAYKASGDNPAIGLMTVLGGKPPAKVTINEMTTIASVWTHNQFIEGTAIKGSALALRIAAGNVPNFVDLQTGGYGTTIMDALNSAQTPTMANFATLANVLAGCVTQVNADACSSVFAASTGPTGSKPADTLAAAESIARYPWYQPERMFALLDQFYPYPKSNVVVRPTPFLPYLTFAPSAWVFPLKFTGGGLSGPGKLMFDSQGNAWAADNFIVGMQNQDKIWAGGLSKLAPNGKPLSPPITGFTGGGLGGPGFGLTLDAADNVWVTSFQAKTISKFDNTGKPLSPPEGWNFNGQLGQMQGIIVAPNGDVWAVDTMKGQVVHFPKGEPAKGELLCQNNTGNPLKNPCKLVAPFGIAIDQQDRIWITNIIGEHVTRFPASDPTKVETFNTGFSGSGLAVDSLGNVWITNKLGSFEHGRLKLLEMVAAAKINFDNDPDAQNRIGKVLVGGMAAQTPGREGGSITVLRPDGTEAPFSPVYGKGIAGPWAISVDGNDHIWISNLTTASAGIVELCGFRTETCPPGMKTGDAISPPGGYVGGGLQMQVDVGIGPAGDVWVTNNWQYYPAALEKVDEALSTLGGGQGVVVFYGMAKPVRTPMVGPPAAP